MHTLALHVSSQYSQVNTPFTSKYNMNRESQFEGYCDGHRDIKPNQPTDVKDQDEQHNIAYRKTFQENLQLRKNSSCTNKTIAKNISEITY